MNASYHPVLAATCQVSLPVLAEPGKSPRRRLRLPLLLCFLSFSTILQAGTDPWVTTEQLFKDGKYQESADAFTRLILSNPKEPRGYIGRGRARARLEDYLGGLADFNRAAILNPDNGTVYTNRAGIYSSLGYYGKAIEDSGKAIALNGRDASAYYTRAIAHALKNEGNLALADFDKAVELAPNNAAYLSDRGVLLLSYGKPDLAIASLDRAVQLAPGNYRYYSSRGYAWLSKGDYAKALSNLNMAIQLEAKAYKAYRNRAEIRLLQGQFQKAIDDCTRAIELNSQDAKSFRIRCAAREALGDAKGGGEDAQGALILGPQPLFGVAVAVSPGIMAREKEALKELQKRNTLENRVKLAGVRHEHAYAIMEASAGKTGKGWAKEALAYARCSTLLDPGKIQYWFLTGLLYRQLDDTDARAAVMAEQAYQHAVELDPEFGEGWLELGLLMVGQQRGWEAMVSLERALESDPERTALRATGILCTMYGLNHEGGRGADFFQELYAANPEVSELGVGYAIMLEGIGQRKAAISRAQDVMAMEDDGTPAHQFAAQLLAEWGVKEP